MFPKSNLKPSVFANNNIYKKINWSNILDSTQKTLGIINQAIPIIYQVKPILSNAKTMFQIANTIKEKPSNSNDSIISDEPRSNDNLEDNKPIFYI